MAVLTAAFPQGLDTSNCGSNTEQSTRFPTIDTSAALAADLDVISWRGESVCVCVMLLLLLLCVVCCVLCVVCCVLCVVCCVLCVVVAACGLLYVCISS